MRRAVIAYAALFVALLTAWQASAQFIGEAVWKSVPASGGCSQATTLIAAMDGSQSAKNSAITTAVCALAADGVWATIDWLVVDTASSNANSKLNWVNPSASVSETGVCTFNASYQGKTGTGSCYQDPNFTPSTAGGNFQSASATATSCAFVFNGSGLDVGVADGQYYLQLPYTNPTGSSAFPEINSNNFPTATGLGIDGGVITLSRTSSAGFTVYNNGGSGTALADALGNNLSKDIYFFARDNDGTADQFSADTLGYQELGGGWTATQTDNFYAVMHNLLIALGAPSGC